VAEMLVTKVLRRREDFAMEASAGPPANAEIRVESDRASARERG